MIKIEVTGNSIPEVADKLLAIGHSLYSKTVAPVANGGTGAKTLEEYFTGVAEKAPVDPTPAPKSAPAATATESLRTTTATSSTPAPAASASELSFETDVTPVVLAVVQTKGKPVVEEVLSQFGVARASQLDPTRWAELIAAMKDRL